METTNLLLNPEDSLRADIDVPTITNDSVRRPEYLVKSLNKFFRDLKKQLSNLNIRSDIQLQSIQTAIGEVAGGVEEAGNTNNDALIVARRYALLVASY